MAEIDGGRLVAKVLKQEGVECLFVLCGGHIDPILQGCKDEGIRVIGTRHEQAAVFMAEGWAWATGKPGVVAVTAGPGVTNAITGLWTALGRGPRSWPSAAEARSGNSNRALFKTWTPWPWPGR